MELAQAPVIEVRINKKTLEVEIEAEGYRGSNCLNDLDMITDILQAQVIDRKPKAEAFYVGITDRLDIKGR